jgi:peptidoglycan lytic transglycosylase
VYNPNYWIKVVRIYRQSFFVLLLAFFLGGALSPSHSVAATQAPKKPHTGKTSAKKKHPVRRRRRSSPRLRRMHQAFIASSALRPMAQQLLQDRTPAAYAGVEVFARRHAKDDAGALAWLVLGYAHILDGDYLKAVDPLNRAKPQAGDLGDYVAYYLGTAYFQVKRLPEAVATFASFDKDFPGSLLTRDAHVEYANVLLADGRPRDAATLLESDRRPLRPDLELALGKAYEATGEYSKALVIFRNLYYTIPLSSEADQAQPDLNKVAQALKVTPTFQERRTRADLLMKGRRYDDAANEYRQLIPLASAELRPELQIMTAEALRKAGKDRDSKQILDSLQNLPSDLAARRLFNLGEIARDNNDDDGFLKILGDLRQVSPTSPWLELALLSAGNIYLLRNDYDKAIDFYRELHERFPTGTLAPYAHWKAAWLDLRQGRDDQAKKEFEEQIALYPTSVQVPAALYWRGRLAEEDHDPATARAYYQKLYERFRNYYYGELARQRLAKTPDNGDPVHLPLLDRVPALAATKITDDEVPDDNLRVQKAELLANGALLDFASRELQAAADEDKGDWLPAETAKLYTECGRYDMAIETLKHAVPSYFAVDLPDLPRPYWDALFPKAYWPDLKKFSEENALDPYLVASLVRQESEFNPNAVSRANAVGLMQLLPKVGKGMAKQEKIRHFSPQQLFTPAVNLRLGTRYFRGMVDKFGSFEYALAAYNAGDNRVQAWLSQGKYRDVPEFVESIPFTETREYVQAIMRNASVYRQLYGTP